jgi:hypothetical protein
MKNLIKKIFAEPKPAYLQVVGDSAIEIHKHRECFDVFIIRGDERTLFAATTNYRDAEIVAKRIAIGLINGATLKYQRC